MTRVFTENAIALFQASKARSEISLDYNWSRYKVNAGNPDSNWDQGFEPMPYHLAMPPKETHDSCLKD